MAHPDDHDSWLRQIARALDDLRAFNPPNVSKPLHSTG
jgi:hypothetical protein